MNYEDLMKERHDANHAGTTAYNEWQKNVVDCLCIEMGFNNKEVMNDAFERAYGLCVYMSHDGIVDADYVYDVVEEFIKFYKRVTE